MMKDQDKLRLAVGVLMSSAAVLAASAALGETLIGSSIESRRVLGFKVADAAVEAMLPEGWVPFTLPGGPVGGANMVVALIDKHLMRNAEGEPTTSGAGPTVALMAYARNPDVEGVRGYVTHVYEEAPVVSPYGNSVPADIRRHVVLSDGEDGGRMQTEEWMIAPDSGGEIQIKLGMAVGGYKWSEGGESRPYSAVNPEFFRIYRYDQLAGLAKSAGMGLELNGSVEVTVSDPDLAALFDGSEELVTILSIPIYMREISLP